MIAFVMTLYSMQSVTTSIKHNIILKNVCENDALNSRCIGKKKQNKIAAKVDVFALHLHAYVTQIDVLHGASCIETGSLTSLYIVSYNLISFIFDYRDYSISSLLFMYRCATVLAIYYVQFISQKQTLLSVSIENNDKNCCRVS